MSAPMIPLPHPAPVPPPPVPPPLRDALNARIMTLYPG